MRFPVAFQRFYRAAPHDVFAAVILDCRAGELLVFLVPARVGYLDVNDDICRHTQRSRLRASRSQRSLLLSFAANSGIFFRRRNRSQLFQVLRMLSRGVRYF